MKDSIKESSILSKFFSQSDWEPFRKAVQVLINEYLNADRITDKATAEQLRQNFDFKAIPKAPNDLEAILTEIETKLLPSSVNMASPLFIGHMTTLLPSFIRPLANLVVAMNQNVVKVETSNAITLYERELLATIHQLIFEQQHSFYNANTMHPEMTLGMMCSGGTVANITALQCARNKAFPNINKHGFGEVAARKSVVFCSAMAHYSIKKAVQLLGIGSDNLIAIPVDHHQRMYVELLEQELKRCQKEGITVIAIVGIAGATESGSIDHLIQLANLAEQYKVHFHVDAAWGGSFLFSNTHKHLLKGIERADTVTIDGHKQLYVPMGIGMLLFKDPTMADNIKMSAEYTIRKNSFDLGQRSFEGSRPANSLYLKFAFDLLGKDGYEELVDRSKENAETFAEMLRSTDDFELLTLPQLNILQYRYLPEAYRKLSPSLYTPAINDEISAFNLELQQRQFDSGKTFVSRTTLRLDAFGTTPIVCLRAVLANPLTTPAHLTQILAHQRALAKEISMH